MAALQLIVDFVDNSDDVSFYNAVIDCHRRAANEAASRAAREDDARRQKEKRGSWLVMLWGKIGKVEKGKNEQKNTTHPEEIEQITVENEKEKEESVYEISDSEVQQRYAEVQMATILRDFLQPDTKLSEDEVVASILALIPEKDLSNSHAHTPTEVARFSEICVELAEQIPYHHPSQLKFAHLVSRLGHSGKFMDRYPIKGSTEYSYGNYQLLRECLADAHGLDEDTPYDWVNINAFEAKLSSLGTIGCHGFIELRHVFESEGRKPEVTAYDILERNLDIMAVAQWIIWDGQKMLSFIIYDEDDSDDDDAGNGNGGGWMKLGDIGDHAPFPPRSVERWQYWARKFEGVDAWPHATEECKGLAARAARLMHVLEENMLFSG